MLAKLPKAWAVAATEMHRAAEAGIHSLGVEIKANLCPFYHSKKISELENDCCNQELENPKKPEQKRNGRH
jgi:hypothetical protein